MNQFYFPELAENMKIKSTRSEISLATFSIRIHDWNDLDCLTSRDKVPSRTVVSGIKALIYTEHTLHDRSAFLTFNEQTFSLNQVCTSMESSAYGVHVLALPTELRCPIFYILFGYQSARLARRPSRTEHLLNTPRALHRS